MMIIAGVFAGASVAAFLWTAAPIAQPAGDSAAFNEFNARNQEIERLLSDAASGENFIEDRLYYLFQGASPEEAELRSFMDYSIACEGECPLQGLPDREGLRSLYVGAKAKFMSGGNEAAMKVELEADMVVGATYDATVAMQLPVWSRTPALDQLADAMQSPTILEDRFDLSGAVRAHLVGGDFEITETKGGWQTVVTRAPSIWTWTVKPKSAGTKTLILVLETEGSGPDGEEFAIPVASYPKTIEVRVSEMQWVGDFWNWASTYAGGFFAFCAAAITGAVGVTQLQQYAENRGQKLAPVRRTAARKTVRRTK